MVIGLMNAIQNPFNPMKGSTGLVRGYSGGKKGVQSIIDFALGKSSRMKNINLLTPEQQNVMSELFENPIENNPLYQSGSSYLQNLLSGGPQAFNQFEQPILNRFQNDISPSIQQRFGGNNTGLNSALDLALNRLTESLGSQRSSMAFNSLPLASQYAQQPQTNLQNLVNQRTFQPIQTSGKQGFLPAALSAYYGGGRMGGR